MFERHAPGTQGPENDLDAALNGLLADLPLRANVALFNQTVDLSLQRGLSPSEPFAVLVQSGRIDGAFGVETDESIKLLLHRGEFCLHSFDLRAVGVLPIGDDLLAFLDLNQSRDDHLPEPPREGVLAHAAATSATYGVIRTGLPDKYSYGIDCDGALVRMVGGLPPLTDKPDSLGLAVASLTGVSFGCAHTIPRLLMPDLIDGRELFGFEFRALGDPVLIDGESHHAIYLREGALLMVVFINEATLVVRRTEGPHPVSVTDYFASLTP